MMRRPVLVGALALAVIAVGSTVIYGVTHAPSLKQAARAGLPTRGGKLVPVLSKGFVRFPAPAIDGHMLGRRASLDLASLRGKPVLINFWASYCDGCNTEASQLHQFASTLRGKATLIGVDVTDPSNHALSFMRRHHIRFPVVADRSGELAYRYGVVGMPTTIVVDARGVVVDKVVGATTAEVLQAKLIAANRA